MRERRPPAGPSEELCLGQCVVTGSLAYESPAKLTGFLWGKNVISYCTLFYFSKLTRLVFYFYFFNFGGVVGTDGEGGW